MKSAILNQLNIIRIREREKLLDQIQDLLKTSKIIAHHAVPDDTIKNLANLNKETNPGRNYETALANYNKLSSALLLLARKNKRISSQIRAIGENLNKLKDFQKDNNEDLPAEDAQQLPTETSNDLLFNELDTSIKAINDDLEELNRKTKTFIPEQFNLNPLLPFNFINKNTETTEGVISIIVLNENGADHLKNLFESFIRFNSYDKYKFIILDRNSSDNSLEITRYYRDKIHLEVLPHDQKYTNSYLYNLAADACQSEFLLFLGNKSILNDDIIPLYLDIFRKEKSCGIIGASLSVSGPENTGEKVELFGSVKFNINEIPGPPDIPFPLIDPDFLITSGIQTSIREYRNKDGVFIQPGSFLSCLKPSPVSHLKTSGVEIVPAVCGSAMLCKRADFILAGGFDLNYFNGYEDIDLCLKFSTRLNKKSVLAHNIQIRLNTENIIAESGITDEITGNYNLGTLLNNHGCYIKNKYFDDLIDEKQSWTTDSTGKVKGSKRFVRSLCSGSEDEIIKLKDKVFVNKIIQGYLDGIRNNKLRIAIKIPAFNNENLQFWGDYHFANSLKNAFLRKGHPSRVDTFESWHEHGYLTDDVVIVLRGIKKYHTRGSQINIMWNISHPEHIEESEYRGYDHVFVASNFFAGELKKKFSINAENLLQCTDPELFYPDTSKIKAEEKTDILFVANSRSVMRKSMEYTMQKGIPVTVYGPNWEKFLPVEMIKGNYIKNEELRKYYSNCNILLNDHWDDMAETGYISNRIFDAMACGAIILTDPVKGIEQTFKEGIYFYRDADELAEQVKWIREHFNKVKQQSIKNSKMVLKNHTFDHRAERILEVALQIHRQRTSNAPGNDIKLKKLFRRLIGFRSL